MTLMPQVHDALHQAARRRARSPRRRWLTVPAAVAGLAVTGAATAALAATGWNPVVGSDEHGHPSVAASPVPAAQSAVLGVLRRPQTDADRGPEAQAMLRLLSPDETDGVRLDDIRLVYRGASGSAVLLPVKRLGDPAHPESVTRDALCLHETRTGADGAGGHCGTEAEVPYGGFRTVTSGLVPDGVASVRVTLKDDAGTVLTAPVHDNYYRLPIDLGATTPTTPAPIREADLTKMRTLLGQPVVWLDADGHQVPKATKHESRRR